MKLNRLNISLVTGYITVPAQYPSSYVLKALGRHQAQLQAETAACVHHPMVQEDSVDGRRNYNLCIYFFFFLIIFLTKDQPKMPATSVGISKNLMLEQTKTTFDRS